jgi:copper homeostasis protein
MSIVSTPGQPPLLEVMACHPADVAGAEEGGADRLLLVEAVEAGGLSPEPVVASAVCRETDLPVRVMLRRSDGYTTTGGELARLVGLAEEYLAVGAEGVVFGFLDADLRVDGEVCGRLADVVAGAPWTFHRAIDATLEPQRAWRAVAALPGVDAVLSAGSARGLSAGLDDLVERATGSPVVSRLLVAGGGLSPEHVPWLVRAGVTRFHVGRSARPGGSHKAYVDARHVRAWRMLLDDTAARTEAG